MATPFFVSTASTTWSTAANWSTGSAPVNSDTVTLNSFGTADITAGLNQSAVTGVTLVKDKSYAGSVGVLSGATATYLQLSGPTAHIEKPTVQGSAPGSPLFMLDGGISPTFIVYDSASTSASTYYPPILLKGTTMSATIQGGTVGIALFPGETSSGTIKITDGAGTTDPSVSLGSGFTATGGITMSRGTIVNNSSATTASVTMEDGTYTNTGTGAHTAVTVNGGTCYYDGTGTITTAVVYGTLDLSRDPRAKTITDCTVHAGGTLNIDNGVAGSITFTNPIQYPDGLGDVKVISPNGMKGSLTNI